MYACLDSLIYLVYFTQEEDEIHPCTRRRSSWAGMRRQWPPGCLGIRLESPSESSAPLSSSCLRPGSQAMRRSGAHDVCRDALTVDPRMGALRPAQSRSRAPHPSLDDVVPPGPSANLHFPSPPTPRARFFLERRTFSETPLRLMISRSGFSLGALYQHGPVPKAPKESPGVWKGPPPRYVRKPRP